jgi:NADH-quinone oxidoreductase subunit F
MDLRLADAPPTVAERAAIDTLLGAASSGWDGGARQARDAHTAQGGHAARGRRHLLLPALQAVQARVGWISPGAFNYVCERLTVPPAEAYGVATFYALLPTVPRPPRVVHVCDDIACRVKGAAILRTAGSTVRASVCATRPRPRCSPRLGSIQSSGCSATRPLRQSPR